MNVDRKREQRKQKALERLGSANPVCVSCGETDWLCLEGHHIAGKNYDDTIVVQCRNCHRKLSDDQHDHPPPISVSTPILLERIGHFLLGLADFFRLLVAKLHEFGDALIELAQQGANPSDLPQSREG